MTPNAIEGFTIVQWAMESTKGTDLPATSKVLFESADFEPEDEVYRPTFINGVILQNTGNEQVQTRGSRWRIMGPATYQQLVQWLELTIQGAVTPTGGPTFVWTHTRNATALPVIDSATFERRLNDGSNQIDNAWHYAMVDALTLRSAPRQMTMLEASGFARRIQTEALTGALALPAVTTMIPHGTTAVFIDSTWANVGTTQVAGQLLDWSLTLRPGHMPFFTADGRSDLDFPVHVLNSRQVGLEFTCRLLVPGTGSQYATEKTAAEAQTLRAVQIKALSPTSPYDLEIDFLAKHQRGSLFQVATQDGQVVTTLNLVGSTDATNFLRAINTNLSATDA